MQFEEQHDRDNELLAAHRVELHWGCDIAQSNTTACGDWVLTRGGELKGYAEFRSRKTPFTQYPTVFIGEHKFLGLLELGRLQNVPVFFVVQHDGELRFVELKPDQGWQVSVTSRREVRDATDVNRNVVNIPTNSFKQLRS